MLVLVFGSLYAIPQRQISAARLHSHDIKVKHTRTCNIQFKTNPALLLHQVLAADVHQSSHDHHWSILNPSGLTCTERCLV